MQAKSTKMLEIASTVSNLGLRYDIGDKSKKTYGRAPNQKV